MIASYGKLRALPEGTGGAPGPGRRPGKGGNVTRLRHIAPALASCCMLCAGLLPWLNDPLGKVYSGWDLPVDIGWQLHIGIFNYGLLCLCCACFSFALTFANWKPFKWSHAIAHRTRLAGCLCLFSVGLFLLQYLCADLVGINQLAEHSKQWLFIQRDLGYGTAKSMITLNPLAIDISTISMRFQLLVNQTSIGPLLALISGCMLIATPAPPSNAQTTQRKASTRLAAWLLFMLALLVLCGRAPASFLCEQQAKALLSQGAYRQALQWLDRAATLNPALTQVAYYHIERGEALYFLQPDQQSLESQFYLASAYLEQRSAVNAYRQLYPLWQAHRSLPWIADEMSVLLERMIEKAQPLSTLSARGLEITPLTPALALQNDQVALSWLVVLTRVDPANPFAQYLIGRIDYASHDYAACIAHMTLTIRLSPGTAIQSSGYTYIALSDAGQGNYIEERTLLLKAIALDPAYWNNTAREELSGLR